MGQTTIHVNNRSYSVTCGAGEEARLELLTAHVTQRIETLQREFGRVGDDKLMVLSLLMMADEVLEARDRVSALEKLLPTKELAKLAELSARQAKKLAGSGDSGSVEGPLLTEDPDLQATPGDKDGGVLVKSSG